MEDKGADTSGSSEEPKIKLGQPDLTLQSIDRQAVPTHTAVRNDRYDYAYVYKDLRKIFVLTSLALALEIFLSLTASNSYAKLLLRALNLDF